MGFRFRKRIKLLPGVHINLSKTGVSTSLGVPGATLNVGRKKPKVTVGIPGTGLSYSQTLGATESTQTPSAIIAPPAGSAATQYTCTSLAGNSICFDASGISSKVRVGNGNATYLLDYIDVRHNGDDETSAVLVCTGSTIAISLEDGQAIVNLQAAQASRQKAANTARTFAFVAFAVLAFIVFAIYSGGRH